MEIFTRRSLGIAAGMIIAVALTAGALISFSSNTSQPTETSLADKVGIVDAETDTKTPDR